eukprot:COSAG05_NODE_16846_length_337_cov_0.945378_1_plen_32_part_10
MAFTRKIIAAPCRLLSFWSAELIRNSDGDASF